MKKVRTPNPELIELIRFLKKQARENRANIWRDIAERLAGPSRQRTSVNLSRLNRYTKRNETVVVPGKVLGTGQIDHAVTVAAFGFSENAKKKIEAKKGKHLTFLELVKKNPKGSNVKIVG